MTPNLRTVLWSLRTGAIINGVFLFAFKIFVTVRINNIAATAQQSLIKSNSTSGEINKLYAGLMSTDKIVGWLFFGGLVILAIIFGSLERIVKQAWLNRGDSADVADRSIATTSTIK
jgi:hypothetical protein